MAFIGSGACHRSASMCQQRDSTSAVFGYSSLSIMFLSAASMYRRFRTSSSIHVLTKVARIELRVAIQHGLVMHHLVGGFRQITLLWNGKFRERLGFLRDGRTAALISTLSGTTRSSALPQVLSQQCELLFSVVECVSDIAVPFVDLERLLRSGIQKSQSRFWIFAGKWSHLRYVKIRMATVSHGCIRARFRNEHRHSNEHGRVLTKRNAHVGLLHILKHV